MFLHATNRSLSITLISQKSKTSKQTPNSPSNKKCNQNRKAFKRNITFIAEINLANSKSKN